MIDSHCHLTDPKFMGVEKEVLNRAREAGVGQCITIADSLEDSRRSLALAERYSGVFCAVGVHPHNAKKWREEDGEILRGLVLQSKCVCAIGEIGLDYHYDFSSRDIQRKVFEVQLRLAKELRVPAVIHARESLGDLLEIISKVEPLQLVLHCCNERYSSVECLIRYGHLLSFAGIATYPNAGEVRETIQRCPLEQMMIETDAPYLAPVPYRGRRNEPAFIVEVVKVIAEVKGIALDEVDRVTTENTRKFFRL